MKKFLVAALLGMAFVQPALSAVIMDTFSFTGTSRDPNGNVIGSGLVTGTISFAGAGTGIQPLSIYITSAPANTLGSGDASTNFTNSQYIFNNSFDVAADGTVSAYSFESVSNFGNGSYLRLKSDGAELSSYSSNYYISNFGANDLVFQTAAAAGAVPEPATWTMMLMGFGAIGFSMRRRARASFSFV